jgi:hypothetical protein
VNDKTLALKYRPLLVLYPEICDDSRRKDHHKPLGLGHRPLDQDYHPRDIRLVLDHACQTHKKGRSWIIRLVLDHACQLCKKSPSREILLDMMSQNSIDYIDLIDSGGPKDVDKFWRVYAQIHSKDNNPEYQKKAYARVIRGSERFKDYILIQYWLAYFFDDWANVHEMDWEMILIVLRIVDPVVEPIACAFNAHLGGFRKPWGYVHKADDDENKNPNGTHPIAYIAVGSHAAYYSDYPPYIDVPESYIGDVLGKTIRTTGIGKAFTDFVPSFNDGEKFLPDVEVIPQPDEDGKWSGDWRWLNFQGRWGSPVQMSFMERRIADIPAIGGIICRIPRLFERPIREWGPKGPNAKGRCWESPFDWINLDCFDAPVIRSWIEDL